MDPEAQTIALSGKSKERVFQITASSKIRRNGEPSRLADLQVGELVGGYARRTGQETAKVVSLNVRSEKKDSDEESEQDKN